MAGEPAAGARGMGLANFSRPARISICPKTYASNILVTQFYAMRPDPLTLSHYLRYAENLSLKFSEPQ